MIAPPCLSKRRPDSEQISGKPQETGIVENLQERIVRVVRDTDDLVEVGDYGFQAMAKDDLRGRTPPLEDEEVLPDSGSSAPGVFIETESTGTRRKISRAVRKAHLRERKRG